jgi:hypothetical protein
VFSLLSKKIAVEPGLAVRINPLFVAPFSHNATWLVTSTQM